MIGGTRRNDAVWRPQNGLVARITSRQQLLTFNENGGIAVHFDTLRTTAPQIEIIGSQNETLCLWQTRSASGFVSNPKFSARLVTLRFITAGQIFYRRSGGDYLGLPSLATLVGFEELRQIEASPDFGAINVTMSLEALMKAHVALNGGAATTFPVFEPTAAVDSDGMRALYCTVVQVQQQMQAADDRQDLMFPLLQEIMSYQLLSVWPRRTEAPKKSATALPPRYLRLALDFIEANLSQPIKLSEIASVAGVSVRAVQTAFQQELGQSPTQFIIHQRLIRAHKDLTSGRKSEISISEIARQWGFVHVSDFGQRYRRLYGCTPTETRRSGGEA